MIDAIIPDLFSPKEGRKNRSRELRPVRYIVRAALNWFEKAEFIFIAPHFGRI
jgi:hypothetical protein